MTRYEHIRVAQEALCSCFDAPLFGCDLSLKFGVSANVRDDVLPLHGVRVAPKDGTNGWFIWAGEPIQEDSVSFLPLQALHLKSWAPSVLPYLGLAPGWRFLLAAGYEDVWKDDEINLD